MFQLTGLMEAMKGEVVLDGENVFGYWPDALRARGVGIIPEDRYRQGVCLPVAVSQNLVAGYHGREPFSKGFRMNYKAVQENYTRLVQEYDIRLSNQDPPVGALSGGNAQKVIVAREFSRDPKLLYASQPTRCLLYTSRTDAQQTAKTLQGFKRDTGSTTLNSTQVIRRLAKHF